jgi:glycerol-3-phosphate acyltransferase PlsY
MCSTGGRRDSSRHHEASGLECAIGIVSNTNMTILWLIGGYLSGSVSSAILVCRLLGHGDPRTVGSGNPGTTNVLRHYGKTPAAMTLLGDVAKGFVPVLLCAFLGFGELAIALAGIGAFVGHLYPVFFGFVGGKGVATLIGVLSAFNIWLGLAFMGCWIFVALVTRYSSLSALTATALSPLAGHLLGAPATIVAAIAVMGLFVFWRHRSNIRNLLTGAEDKIGGSSASP